MTEDALFVVSFTLKITRTLTGIWVHVPVIKGKYASYLLRVPTKELVLLWNSSNNCNDVEEIDSQAIMDRSEEI
jgi:hypothetical protein